MTDQPTTAERAKATRIASRVLVLAAFLVGVGMPALFWIMKFEVVTTDSGFDLIWLAFGAAAIIDLGLAFWLARRADRLEGSIPPA